jgi:hypothetical protein
MEDPQSSETTTSLAVDTMNIQIITNDREMYRKADELGLRDLLGQTAEQIHRLADVYPGESRFVINKSISNWNAFVVVIVTRAGLFADAVMLFNSSTSELSRSASSTIEEIAQDFAQRMMETLGARPCICDGCGQPTNLN